MPPAVEPCAVIANRNGERHRDAHALLTRLGLGNNLAEDRAPANAQHARGDVVVLDVQRRDLGPAQTRHRLRERGCIQLEASRAQRRQQFGELLGRERVVGAKRDVLIGGLRIARRVRMTEVILARVLQRRP